jgi:hypothetical protein
MKNKLSNSSQERHGQLADRLDRRRTADPPRRATAGCGLTARLTRALPRHVNSSDVFTLPPA